MAVNKNFVVKNGLEVNTDLILADSDTKRVGIGSTVPQYNLDVAGGIGVTHIYVSGISTSVGFSTFNSDIYVAGVTTVVGVATFRSDVYIDGNLNVVGDIVYDEVNGRNIYISGLSTFVGMSTFKSDIFVAGVSTFSGDIDIHGSAGVTSVRWDQSQQSIEFLDETKAVFGTNNDLQISHTNSLKDQNDSEGESIVDGWTSYINENGTGGLVFKSNGNTGEGAFQFFDTSWRPLVRLFSGSSARTLLYHAGLNRFETTGVGVTVHGSVGILTDLSVAGIATVIGRSYFASNVGVGTTNPATAAHAANTKILNVGVVTANYIYGDISGATGVSTNISAAIGVSSEGTFVGSGSTIINFVSSNGSAWDISASGGIATATMQAGVSLGLAIALGG